MQGTGYPHLEQGQPSHGLEVLALLVGGRERLRVENLGVSGGLSCSPLWQQHTLHGAGWAGVATNIKGHAVSGRTTLNLGSQASAGERTLLWPTRRPPPQGAEPTARTELPQPDRTHGVPHTLRPCVDCFTRLVPRSRRCHSPCISGWPWKFEGRRGSLEVRARGHLSLPGPL